MNHSSTEDRSTPPTAGVPSVAREATRGSAIKLAADTLSRALGFATTVLVAQRLEPAGFGVFAPLAFVAVLAADLSDLGLQLTATQALVARTLRLRDIAKARAALTGLTLLIAAAAGLASPVLAVLIVYFVSSNWCEFVGVALRVRGRRVQEAVVLACLRAVCFACVFLAGSGLMRIAWAHALSTLPPLALAFALARRAYRAEAGLAPTPAATIVRGALRLGLNNVLTLSSLRLELMLLFWLSTEAQTGLFAAALRCIEFLVSVPAAIAAGAMPALTREALDGGSSVRRRTAFTAALLAVPAAAGLAIVARDLMRFDPSYANATPLLRVLALAVVPLFMNGVMSYTLIAAGKGHVLPQLTAWRLVVAATCACVLIPTLGPLGASCGFACSEVVLLALMRRACRRVGFAIPIGAPLLVALLLTLPMAIGVAFAPGGLAVRLVVGVVSYGLTLLSGVVLVPRLRHVIVDA